MVKRCALVIADGATRAAAVDAARSRCSTLEGAIEVMRSTDQSCWQELRSGARRGTIGTVVFDTLESRGSVLSILRELRGLGELEVELVSLEQSWLSAPAARECIRWIVGRLDAERSERVRAALSHVRAEGRPLGRPRAIIPAERVFELRRQGASLRAIARQVGLGVSTIQRFLKSKGEGAP
ncbi:MAG TPA: helix-turn-helix domain-containing protein [Polyangiaceae bacterium]|nr:helix-turn-helix domain-containing protein [Polyangiaceae bacterium]